MDSEDLERIRDDYTDADGALTIDDIEEDLASEGFEGSSLDAASEGIAGAEDLAVSQEALNSAQRQAIDSLGDGGATGTELIRSNEGSGPPKTIGSPQNVEQSIERTGRTSGDVIATNRNTGTSGKIGEVELAPPPEGS
jgi:hypothetical protein